MAHDIPQKLRKQVYERSECLCEICKSNRGLNVHHIIKRSTWRTTENIHSLILLCVNCHREAHQGKLNRGLKVDLQLVYFEMGYTNEETRTLLGGRFYYELEDT